jgi:hypothetical protein
MLTLFSRLATLAVLLQQVVCDINPNIKSSVGYLRSTNKASGNHKSMTRRSQGLFSSQAVGSVSTTVASTSSSLTQINTITQGGFSTTKPTTTVSGVIALYNGIQQGSGLASIGNLLISLQDQNGQTISTTTTSSDGTWTIANVEPGYYKLNIDVPSGFTLMGYNSNELSVTTDSVQNSAVSVNCVLASITGSQAAVGSVTGTLLGLNSYSDVTITISDVSGNIIATTKADMSGKFTFASLVEGTYSIHVDIPSLDSSMVATTTTSFQVTVLSNQVTDVSFQPTGAYSQDKVNPEISSNSVFSYRY